MEAHFKPGGVGSYSFVGDNEVRFNKLDRLFDAVLMMDCSQCPVHPELAPLFHEYVKKHSATARRHGAEPILFMSWAYSDKPEMTEQLAAEYVKAGKANNALVVPAGLAFANSVGKRPDLSLVIADKRHPSLMGTYLAACTVMASVYKQNPVGNSYTAGLPADVAAHLQAVAWETARDFHAEARAGQPVKSRPWRQSEESDMKRASRPHDEAVVELLRDDHEFAGAYLSAVLAAGDDGRLRERGPTFWFLAACESQKARNLAHDDAWPTRTGMTHAEIMSITGLSTAGEIASDRAEAEKVIARCV